MVGFSTPPSLGNMPTSDTEEDLSESEFSDQLDASTFVKDVNKNVSLLVNKVLAFTWSMMQKKANEDTAQLLVKSFKSDDVVEAKAALWSHCRGHLEIIGRRKMRRDSVGRSGALAHARDIIGALQKLDMTHKVPTIVVDACDLPSLPSCAVRSENGDMDIRLAKLESVCKGLQDALQKFCKSNVQSCFEDRMSALENVCQQLQQTTANFAEQMIVQTMNPKGQSVEEHMQTQKPSAIVEDSSEALELPPAASSASTSQTFAGVTGKNKGSPDNDGFQTMRRRKPARKMRPIPKGSGSESEILVTGPTTFKVVITNVCESVNEDDLKTFFREKGLDPPLEIEDRTSDGWSTKRFVLTLPTSKSDKVMVASF